tara:strand:- start:34 stop:408 length:375 start_codon:yes stop_codon:yes gene_type:complete
LIALLPIEIPSASALSLEAIVYEKTKAFDPLPLEYDACLELPPTLIVTKGVPPEVLTRTLSLNVAVTETTSPAFRKLLETPDAEVIATDDTVGAVVSAELGVVKVNLAIPDPEPLAIEMVPEES